MIVDEGFNWVIRKLIAEQTRDLCTDISLQVVSNEHLETAEHSEEGWAT